MAHVGYKQTPEHTARLLAKRKKIIAAKHKLGLRAIDPLPPDHPLASKHSRTKQAKPKPDKKTKTNGKAHAKVNGNGADHAAIDAVLAAVHGTDEVGTSFPLDLIPERPPKPVKRYQAHPRAPVMPPERLAKLQLAAALIQAVNKILD